MAVVARWAAALLATGTAASTLASTVTVQDRRIDEASGLAPGLRSPGVVYIQNDSGDTNRVFAVDPRTGATRAVVRITGATNVDWEDIAVARDAAGTASLWVADIGDNDAVRTQVRLYRVDEPAIGGGDTGRTIRTAPAQVWRLRYPDGAHDAESLAVTPRGTAYVITKSPLGVSGVYRVPDTPGTGTQTMRHVGTVRFAITREASGPVGALSQLLATGATISPDGRLLVVRTYTDAYVWSLRGRSVTAALATAPVRVALPEQKQGEGVAVVDGRLLVDSEGVRQPLRSVALPGVVTRTPSTPPLTATVSAPPDGGALTGGEVSARGAGATRWIVLAAVSAAIVLLGAGLGLVRRRRTAPAPDDDGEADPAR